MRMLSKQRGLSLTELMIAGAIGVIVSLFIADVMISSTRTSIQSEGVAEAQENGRFISSWLQTRIRMAGYAGIDFEKITPVPWSADVAGNPCNAALPPIANADCLINTDNAASDRLAIRREYYDDPLTAAVTDQMRTCSGVEMTGMNNDDVVIDVYWVANDGTGRGLGIDENLFCITYEESTRQPHPDDPAATAIANGVEGLQVLYGISRNAGDKDIERYISSDQLTNALRDRVRSIRFAVLTRSFSDNNLSNRTRAYVLLDADDDTYVFADTVARHSQSTTVYLPNE